MKELRLREQAPSQQLDMFFRDSFCPRVEVFSFFLFPLWASKSFPSLLPLFYSMAGRKRQASRRSPLQAREEKPIIDRVGQHTEEPVMNPIICQGIRER